MRTLWTPIVAALLAALLLAAAPAAAKPPADFVGLAGEDLALHSLAKRERNLRAYARAGAGIVRFPVRWIEFEKTPGRFDLTRLDREVIAAAGAGVRLLPVLTDPPDFRSRRPAQGAKRGAYPPRNNTDMAQFAARLALRYGPNGSLWRERSDVPALPIRSWQIWNEPNLPFYWRTGVNPAGYVELLRVVGAALKEVDPDAEIVAAGLPRSRLGMSVSRFVRKMYKAGARGSYDVFALHPYAVTDRGAIRAVRSTRRLLRGQGDGRRPIWLTEVGWATGGPDSSFKTTERGQARRIRGLLLGLAARRKRLRVRGVVYYNWRDGKAVSAKRDFFGLHTGLLRRTGKKKPGYRAFRRAARKLRD